MAQRTALGNLSISRKGNRGTQTHGLGGGWERSPLRGISRPRGFTLVEVLVSAVFLSLAFLALITVFAAGRVSVRKSFYTLRAASAGTNKIEMYRGYGYANISGTSTDTVAELPEGNEMITVISSYGQVADSTGLKMVTATMTWPGRGDAEYEGGRIVCRTLIAERQYEADYRAARGY